MSYVKEMNSPLSPHTSLSSYSKTGNKKKGSYQCIHIFLVINEDDNFSNYNFSVASEPIDRRKMASSINSLPGTNGRKSIFQKRPCIHF